MINVKVEKLCKSNHKREDAWLLSHVKFCRTGDIVRINGIKETIYKCVSDPIWSDEIKGWDMKFILWDLV